MSSFFLITSSFVFFFGIKKIVVLGISLGDGDVDRGLLGGAVVGLGLLVDVGDDEGGPGVVVEAGNF
mgnify:CR=1 FL=1